MSWLLGTLIVVLVSLFRWQGDSWPLVVSKVAMLVGSSSLLALLIAAGLSLP